MQENRLDSPRAREGHLYSRGPPTGGRARTYPPTGDTCSSGDLVLNRETICPVIRGSDGRALEESAARFGANMRTLIARHDVIMMNEIVILFSIAAGFGIFGTACDCCERVVARFTLEECEDCDTVYCIDECVDEFNECYGCGGYLCCECGKHWRGELYCNECYVFPHDD